MSWGSLQPWGALAPWGGLGLLDEPDGDAPRTIREAVYHRLATGAAIASLVAGRVYPGGLPQSCELPALSYAVAGGREPRTLRRSTGYRATRVRVSAWSASEAEAAGLVRLVRDRLVDHRGWVGEVYIGSVAVESEIDLPERPDEGMGDWSYQVVLDLRIWHHT